MRSKIITYYLSILYINYLVVITFFSVVFLVVSCFFDVLARYKSSSLSIVFIVKVILYKIPYLLSQILPLLIPIAALCLIYKLQQSNELIIFLNSGLSIQRILSVPIIIAFIVSMLNVTVINTLGSKLINQAEMPNLKSDTEKNQWIEKKVAVTEVYNNSRRIIVADAINLAEETLGGFSIIEINSMYNTMQRWTAAKAKISNNLLIFTNSLGYHEIPTGVSFTALKKTLDKVDTLSIWSLYYLINILGKIKASTTEHVFYYYKLLLRPIAQVLIMLFAFAKLRLERNFATYNLIYGIIISILLYFFMELSSSFFKCYTDNSKLSVLSPIGFLFIVYLFKYLGSKIKSCDRKIS